jgi:hypothetical protein
MINRAFRAARAPLVAYYVVTVVVPLANGSGNTSRAFLEHIAFALLAPPTFVALFALLTQAWRLASRSFKRSNERPHDLRAVLPMRRQQ